MKKREKKKEMMTQIEYMIKYHVIREIKGKKI